MWSAEMTTPERLDDVPGGDSEDDGLLATRAGEGTNTTPKRGESWSSIMASQTRFDYNFEMFNGSEGSGGGKDSGGPGGGGGGGELTQEDFEQLGFPNPIPNSSGGNGDNASVASMRNPQQYHRNCNVNGCNLIVNYIPQFFTDRNLYNLFIPFGVVQSVKVMRDRKSGYSFGFGFVNYERPQAAHCALIAMNGKQVENKRLKVSYARPASEEIKNTNLYITNIPKVWTENELFKLFSYFGEIVHLNLLRDPHNGESRGVAFVRYAYRWEANNAIKEVHMMRPQGAQECIKVRLAEDHGKQKAAFMAGFELANKKNELGGRFRSQPYMEYGYSVGPNPRARYPNNQPRNRPN